MILADTSIWIDHFRSEDEVLGRHLMSQQIVIHPIILGELALGMLPQRARTLGYLKNLPRLKVARTEEMMRMVEARGLYGKDIGWMDAHLIASVLIEQPVKLWTRDKRLRAVAEELGIHAGLL